MQTKNNLELLCSHHLAIPLLTTGSHWRFKNHINIKLAVLIKKKFSPISGIKFWIEYFGQIFDWMNISNLVLNWILNWIIFGPDSMFDWIIETYRTGLSEVSQKSNSGIGQHSSVLEKGYQSQLEKYRGRAKVLFRLKLKGCKKCNTDFTHHLIWQSLPYFSDCSFFVIKISTNSNVALHCRFFWKFWGHVGFGPVSLC